MIGRPGKWPWKKPSLIVTALIAVIDASRHRAARRGRPAASDSDAAAPPSPAGYPAGRWRRCLLAVSLTGPAGGCCGLRRRRSSLTDGSAGVEARRVTSSVTSIAGAQGERRRRIDQHGWRRGAHHLLVRSGSSFGADLLQDIGCWLRWSSAARALQVPALRHRPAWSGTP